MNIPLSSLPVGKSATVTSLSAKGAERRRFLDLGIVRGSEIAALMKSPFGDPTAYSIRGAVIALRHDDARKINMDFQEEIFCLIK